MKKLLLSFVGVALALFVIHGVNSASAQNRNDGRAGQYGSSDAQQHGYEHGYRDGADQGRQDRERRQPYSYRESSYQDAIRYYDRADGSRREFVSGYQDGFKIGYDDGYKDKGGRYSQIYQRPGADGRGPGYNPGRGASPDAAFDAGYREGIAAGQQDQQRNTRSNFRGSRSYQGGDAQYKDGVERGYQDGYGRTQHGSDGGGYFPNQGRSGAADTRDGAGTPNRTITVPANRQWTPTSITVRQGDTMHLNSSGEILISANGTDKAITAGSLQHRLVPGAPIPSALAGALLGRIDSGQPFGIGNQTSIVIPASGLLYLGINDDNVGDNTGQFQVAISW